jgi:hypothetical protein
LPNRGAGFARPVRKQRSVLLGSRISCSGGSLVRDVVRARKMRMPRIARI